MSRGDTARQKHRSGYSCSQAAYCTYADKLGLTDAEARRKSSSWAGGAKVLCGAVYSAEQIIRELYPERAEEMIRQYEEEYIRRNGYVDCRKLTSMSNEKRKSCNEYVGSAIDVLEDLFAI